LFAFLRWTNTNPIVALLQQTGRMGNILFVFSHIGKTSPYPAMAIIAWCFAELIRFGSYMNDGFNAKMSWIKHIRYNAFIILYPTGAIGEFLSCIEADKVYSGNLELFGH